MSANPAAAQLDATLDTLLRRCALRIEVVAEPHQCGDWFLQAPDYACGLFHLVGAGSCQVESEVFGQREVLQQGDLIVLPHGSAHSLRAANPECTQPTSLICGELHFTSRSAQPLSRALPHCMVVRASDADPAFRELANTIIEVARSQLPARKLLLDKLAEGLFALAVCDFAKREQTHTGLFAALADPRIGRVVHAIHEQPGHAWTMQSMAALACLSRSSFAERFTSLLGMAPMQYVTQWRVNTAEHLLQHDQLPVAVIAEQLGYRSEAAFRRLVKRVSGRSPGELRQSQAVH